MIRVKTRQISKLRTTRAQKLQAHCSHMPLVLDVQTFRRPAEGNEKTTTLEKVQGKEEAEAKEGHREEKIHGLLLLNHDCPNEKGRIRKVESR